MKRNISTIIQVSNLQFIDLPWKCFHIIQINFSLYRWNIVSFEGEKLRMIELYLVASKSDYCGNTVLTMSTLAA